MLREELSKDVDLLRLIEEEKKARLDNDAPKGSQLCIKIIEYVYEKKDYESVNILLISLNKRRNQSREAITQFVKYALNTIYKELNSANLEEEKVKLLNTLVEITQGRIFVEMEFSIAIRELTELHLKKSEIDQAAKLIQDIQIETFGSLERKYKLEYILFQMRILLRKEDYVRTLIVSNKVNRRHLNEEGLETLKFEFYDLMIKYYLHEEKYIDVSKSFKTLFDFIKELELKNSPALALPLLPPTVTSNTLFVNYVMFLSICPPELETKNMFNELNLNYKKNLEGNEDMLNLVVKRLSDDVVYVDERFLGIYGSYPIFKDYENSVKHIALFRKFWIQHNLIIFEKYFSQVKLDRIATMVGTKASEVETELADMVINNYIYAKINRINSTVNFRRKQDSGDKLDDLNYDLNKMLEKIENTCHLIHKENLKYGIK